MAHHTGEQLGPSATDPETFDDSEFYQQLLREFLEASNAPGSLGTKSSTRGKKSKAMVDRRASKGRRLRYDVQVQHLNFFLLCGRLRSVITLKSAYRYISQLCAKWMATAMFIYIIDLLPGSESVAASISCVLGDRIQPIILEYVILPAVDLTSRKQTIVVSAGKAGEFHGPQDVRGASYGKPAVQELVWAKNFMRCFNMVSILYHAT